MSKKSGRPPSREEEELKERIRKVLEEAEDHKVPFSSFWNNYRQIHHSLPDPEDFNLPKRSAFFRKFNDVVEVIGEGKNSYVTLKSQKTKQSSSKAPPTSKKALPKSAVWASPQHSPARRPTALNNGSNKEPGELLGSSSSEEDTDGLPEGFIMADRHRDDR